MIIKREDHSKKLRPLTIRETEESIPTPFDVIVESVGRYRTNTFKEIRQYGKLAEQILDQSESDINLSNIEEDMIMDGLKQNPAQYFPFYLNQVIERFEQWAKSQKT